MIDIHNHIIPGIDDGAQTLAESLALLQLAIDDGITHIVCTPHMHAGRFDNNITTIQPAFMGLQAEVVAQNMPISLAMSAEVRISDEFMIQLKQGKVPFLGEYKNCSVVLLEMPHDRIPLGIENLLRWLERQNIVVMLAHPERNKEIMCHPERVLELANKGVLLQLTAASLTGCMGKRSLITAHWLLQRDLVFCVASDAHNVRHRPPAMGKAYSALCDFGGRELAERLCLDNPEALTASLFKQV